MSAEKASLVEQSASNFKKLPEKQKMFVLGIMQGILISQTDENKKDLVLNGSQ